MKIQKLLIRNINSLYGTWEIDFTAPEYAAGLFAITGPTGSGKTTILDAISLALFAETPRIGHGENKEVVSRGATDCLAELIFESGADLYMASFAYGTVKRGPRKGQINDLYTHKLAKNGLEIADKTSIVRKIVEEITGLDRDRFTRTVMLAQGKFDAFLNAGDAKAAILEQITGTEIYSTIAAMIKSLHDAENAKLEQIKAVCGGILLLDDETEAAKRTELASLQQEAGQLKNTISDTLNELKLAENTERLSAARNKNDEAISSLMQEKKAFKCHELRLQEGRRTEPLRQLYTTHGELQQAKRQILQEMGQLENDLPALESAKKTAETNAEKNTEHREKIRKKYAALQELVKEIQLLDAAIAESDRQIRRLDAVIARECDQITTASDAYSSTGKQIDALKEKLEKSQQYVQEHSADSILPEKAAAWHGALQQILERRACIISLTKEKTQAENNLKDADKARSDADTAVHASLGPVSALREEIQKLQSVREQADSRESLHDLQEILLRNIRTIRTIVDHAEERKHLQEGEPCPLCGATEHPFADPDAIPVQEQNEKDLAEVRKKLAALDTLEQKIRDQENALHRAENKLQQAQNSLKMAEQHRAHAEQLLQQKNDAYDEELHAGKEKWEQLKNALADAGFDLPEKASALPPDVDERIRAYRNAEKNMQEFEQEQTRLQAALSLAARQKSDAETRKKDAVSERATLQTAMAKQEAERNARFGTRNPEMELKSGENELKNAEEKQIAAEKEAVRTNTQWQDTRTRHKKLEEESGKLADAIDKSGKELAAQCSTLGIVPEDLPEKLLDPAELAQLSAQEADLSAREKNLIREKQILQTELDETQKKRQSGENAATLRQLVQDLTGKQNRLAGTLGALQQEIEQNENNKKRLAEKRDELTRQEKQTSLWSRLYNLIGKGNLFQRIAQGITLDNLLAMANGELKKLYSRYELIRSEKDQLGLDVVDHDQGDEVRPCSNLSGGERFVVSLALALGLSSMAGEKIRIDSFFLDEGFGTLDSNSLQIVMHALAQLRSGGKLVGIISHVSNLADEIPCVITVNRNGGGRSSLSGPGVSLKA